MFVRRFTTAAVAVAVAGALTGIAAPAAGAESSVESGARVVALGNSGSDEAMIYLSSASGALLIPIILPFMCLHPNVDCLSLGSSLLPH
ncbi:hypothetical protein [Nocardia sp. NPDC058666]|uniref:hypothetical protein n=1 Tax=unclassified Nocardia TaxID=2637762 RepID=UPI0036479B0F